MKPGYNTEEELMTINRKFFNRYVKFIRDSGVELGKCADMGPENAKMNYIRDRLDVRAAQIDNFDFNYKFHQGEKYDTLFCFEVFEHIANPLMLMKSMRRMLYGRGVMFISIPARPRMFWGKYHFHEIDPERFERWICEPLGLKIVRRKKLFIDMPLRFWFTGFRPLLRLFFNYTNIYQIESISNHPV